MSIPDQPIDPDTGQPPQPDIDSPDHPERAGLPPQGAEGAATPEPPVTGDQSSVMR